ncbi:MULTISPECIES: M28 family peptidase [Bacteroidaceae]|uniref:M28 family peptidase n=1 Tax=Bacteroidaceae TaxID=815 RepID=UPI002620D068|nr:MULTISPECIES: M28 family peptidase [Bacteroidaceae]
MKTISDSALARLTSLLDVISPSMQEQEMISYLKNDWRSVESEGQISVDAIGNVEFVIRRNDLYPTLALAAHADTICVQITQRVGMGKYRFRSIGCSPHMLLGQKVIIVNEAGEKFNGVVGFDATSQFGQPKGLVFEDLWIDVPCQEHCQSIDIGDLVVLRPNCIMDGDCMTSTALDDRLGLFVIGEVLRWYSQSDTHVNLTCVATAQEEVGLRGSQAFNFSHTPDAVIVLDVDYATDTPTPHEDQMGRLYLGQGPGVLKKADNSPLLRNIIKSAASARNIPLQTSLGRFLYGGTDCTSLQAMRDVRGIPVANVTLPVRYMHSPVETASLADVAHAIELIEGVAEDMSTPTV